VKDELPVVDLRSDTVTRPDADMRRAMAEAEVGDDVLDGDPTTRRLEARVARMLGKERALFFPSGVMANQSALAVLGGWGAEVVCEAGAHVMNYEAGAAAALSGVQLRSVETPDGRLTPELLRHAIRPDSPYLPRTRAVALENTHLDSGGRILEVEELEELVGVAREHDLPVHLDGARLWHAAVERGEEPAAWARPCDTVMVSLSKGLGCPVGSLLAGSRSDMERAWHVRRRLGGAMRQSGILAAAGIHALDTRLERLAEDHDRARRLAAAFDRIEGCRASGPETNIVLVDIDPETLEAAEILSFLAGHRILMLNFGGSRLRAVTHGEVTEAGMEHTIACLRAFDAPGQDRAGVA